MKPWTFLALLTICLVGCESTEGIQAINPVVNELHFTGTYFPASEVDVKPTIVKQTPPQMPSKLIKAGLEGKAFVVCIVNTNGDPEQIQVQQATEPMSAQAAADAVRKWKFTPGKKGGQVVNTMVNIPIELHQGRLE
jgi:TonB family protein